MFIISIANHRITIGKRRRVNNLLSVIAECYKIKMYMYCITIIENVISYLLLIPVDLI